MKKILNGTNLKIIAIITMFVDHFGQIILKNGIILNAPYSAFSDEQFNILMSAISICHILGRIAFPIFCFLLTEGFIHTKNTRKYLINLLIFAAVSEPIYDLAFSSKFFSVSQQNVLFNLFLGLITLIFIKKFDNILLSIIITAIIAYISFLCKIDGWYYGICLISVFYIFRENNKIKFALSALTIYICGLDFSVYGILEPNFIMSVCSLLFIYLYNGQRGKRIKYFFYMFYPLHLFILFIISKYLIAPIF